MDGAGFGQATWAALSREKPDRSARRRVTFVQALWITAFVGSIAWAARAYPLVLMATLYIAAFAMFAVSIAWRLVAAAASLASAKTPPPAIPQAPDDAPIYTILCPLYREAGMVRGLIAALERIDYPRDRLDIKLILEADDFDTQAAADLHAWGAMYDIVLVPQEGPRTKPKALNVALARARGAYCVVYDAEDRPHPAQLRAALHAFATNDETLACVQAPLAPDNLHAGWLARQFAAEYAIQFGEILPLLARLSLPLPLGGTSNHFHGILAQTPEEKRLAIA